MTDTQYWTLEDWQQAYENGAQPATLLTAWLRRQSSNDPAWISLLNETQLQMELQALEARRAVTQPGELPLYGVPVAVKDNIDVVGFDTTAACAEFAYRPERDATAVALLRAAGAIIVAKTNLDQFATGLVGMRSPWGEVPNSFDPDRVCGGSSSGSASAVARGLIPVALGTDTAGSGRVPAGCNNIVGLKGTCGAISAHGVVPACRTLDCVSVLALTLADASKIFSLLCKPDTLDPWSRSAPTGLRSGELQRLGIPTHPPWFGDDLQEAAWTSAIEDWRRLGVELVEVDFKPLWSLAALLYEGPWVAERHAAIANFMADHADAMNPVVRDIINQARNFSATDAFNAEYQRQSLRRDIELQLAQVDCLLVPTTPCFPTRQAIREEPVAGNARLGTYTNFVNLSDRCALSVPSGFRADGLPFGVTLIADAWRDIDLQQLAARWLGSRPQRLGNGERPWPMRAHQPAEKPSERHIELAVVGAHLTGMPLNGQLTERQAELIETTRTADQYRLYALADSSPPKPGLVRTEPGGGANIEVEVWRLPVNQLGAFMALVPAPLGIGTIDLQDGRSVKGFICEHQGLSGATDITHFGGWRAFRAGLT